MSILAGAVRYTGGGHMKYMLLIHVNEQFWDNLSENDKQLAYAEYRQLLERIKSTGKYVGSARLLPSSSATSVRVREGKRLVTDGPFAETREQLGGYFLVEADSVEEAVGVAALIPAARHGTIEVRPVMDVPVTTPV
jgi:hypothetical protein